MQKLIYIVEDNPDIRDLIEYLLNEDGFSISSFGTVDSFRAGLKAAVPDMIILDIMLPDGNGLEVCREVKEASTRMPILLMSANLGFKFETKSFDRVDFIGKPFDIAEFSNKVSQLI